MRNSIQAYSQLLWANYQGVRLLHLWDTKGFVPVCFTNFDQRNYYANFYNLLASYTKILDVKIFNHGEYAIVLAEEPKDLLILNDHQWLDEEYQKQVMKIVRKD